jgi:hypothetical protein
VLLALVSIFVSFRAKASAPARERVKASHGVGVPEHQVEHT